MAVSFFAVRSLSRPISAVRWFSSGVVWVSFTEGADGSGTEKFMLSAELAYFVRLLVCWTILS